MNKTIFTVSHNGNEFHISSCHKKISSEYFLFLHGVQSNQDIFKELFKIVPDDCSMLSADFIGFGDSSKPMDFSYDLADQTKIIKELLTKLKVKKLHIVGHSMGGMVGTLLLRELREKVVSFVNMEGNLILKDSGLSKEISSHTFDEFKNKYLKIKGDLKKSSEISASKRVKWLAKIPDFAFYKSCLSISTLPKSTILLDIFNNAKCFRLYVYGDKKNSDFDYLDKSIELSKIPNAGHFMLLDNPDYTFSAIRDFYKRKEILK